MTAVNSDKAPAALGPYSHAHVSGNLVFVSGQLGIVPETGEFAGSSVTDQTQQACANLAVILEAAGSDMGHVLKSTCFLADLADFGEFNAEYAKHFPSNPARECVQVAALPKAARVEVSVIAELA